MPSAAAKAVIEARSFIRSSRAASCGEGPLPGTQTQPARPGISTAANGAFRRGDAAVTARSCGLRGIGAGGAGRDHFCLCGAPGSFPMGEGGGMLRLVDGVAGGMHVPFGERGSRYAPLRSHWRRVRSHRRLQRRQQRPQTAPMANPPRNCRRATGSSGLLEQPVGDHAHAVDQHSQAGADAGGSSRVRGQVHLERQRSRASAGWWT